MPEPNTQSQEVNEDVRPQPQTNEDVTRLLADTIGADVLEQMENVGWEHTESPPTAKKLDNPTAAGSTETTQSPETADNPPSAGPSVVEQKTIQSGIDWESFRDPDTGLILKKYKDEAAAVKGIGHAMNMLKQGLTRVETVEQENERLRKEIAAKTTTPVSVPDTPQLDESSKEEKLSPKLAKVLAKIKEEPILDEEGMQELVEGILEHSTSTAEKAARNVLLQTAKETEKDNTEWAEVDSYMQENYPESMNFVDELGLFARTNPEVSEVVNYLISKGKRKEATAYAWKEYSSANSIVVKPKELTPDEIKEIELSEADKVHKEAREKAMKDAGIISTGAGGVHEIVHTGPTQEDINNAGLEMLKSADGTKWRNLVFGPLLKGPIFDET